MPRQEIYRDRALQRQVVQVVIEQHGHIAPDAGRREQFVCAARSMHHHPGVRPGAIEDAVVDELALIVEKSGVGGTTGGDLLHIAGGGVIEHRRGVGPDQMNLL